MTIKSEERQIIRRCQESALWFIRNFVKIKHPGAGIIPFEPFDYQEHAIRCFRKHRMNIFRKARQVGISRIAGIFMLWYGMFSPHRTILIVSRKDDDAMQFLKENVKLSFQYLPEWMRDLWKPVKDNEHILEFPNGSIIRSLTSHPDVLRSNASSLNLIDEAAHIPEMDQMWAAARPTLMHGGSVIVVSTTCGVGNWYWNTWTDAEARANDFNPIVINWWDMKWQIEYKDQLSGKNIVIAPTEGIRECKTKEEIERYGKYWSPWLEEQYRALQAKGETWKFAQEILCDFIGSGNTILPKSVLNHLSTTISESYTLVTGPQTYVHPVNGSQEALDFTPDEPEEGFWIWKNPVLAKPERISSGRLIEKGASAHTYVMGVDTMTGKGRDYHALEIIDVDTQEQVAEMMIRCLPREFVKIIDRIGRWYNCAMTVVERNNGGDILIEQLRTDFMYPSLWRQTNTNGKSVSFGYYGWFTSAASKPALNKYLLDHIRDQDGQGIKIFSRRLVKQLQIYVRKRDRAGRDTGRTEAEAGAGNHDDLVLGFALAIVGIPDSISANSVGILPLHTNQLEFVGRPAEVDTERLIQSDMLIPMTYSPQPTPDQTAYEEMMKFVQKLGGIPQGLAKELMPPVKKKKHQLS